jgi:hypothetical protein
MNDHGYNRVVDKLYEAAELAVLSGIPIQKVLVAFKEGWDEAIDNNARSLKDEAERAFK